MRHVHDAALRLDGGDRLGERHATGDRPLQEQADDLAFAGLDLLPDDHTHAVAVSDLARLEAAGGLEAREIADRYGVRVIVGEEVKTSEGEVIGLFPVSYTHLRAHETGRNLVC